MTDIKKICEAMAALAAAIPGAPSVTSVNLHGCADVTLRMLVDARGRRETYENDAGTEEWDCATLDVGAVTIHAYGPHRPIVRAEIDSAAVESALALAEEAVSQ